MIMKEASQKARRIKIYRKLENLKARKLEKTRTPEN